MTGFRSCKHGTAATGVGIAQLAFGALAFLASASGVAGNLPTDYSVQKIGPSSGMYSSNFLATDINDAGYFVGMRYGQAVIGNVDSIMPLPGAGSFVAAHINSKNEVVGTSYYGMGAVYWNNGVTVDLHPPGGYFSRANSINSSSQIVGVMADSTGWGAPTIWEQGVARWLPTIGGTRGGAAHDINDAGVIVGFSRTAEIGGFDSPVYWANSSLFQLPTLGGNSGIANAINASGQIAGNAALAGNAATHATIWTNGVPVDLGVLGGNHSIAFDINSFGYALGRSTIDASSTYHAVLWADSQIIDLNTYLDSQSKADGWVLDEGTSINSSGQIIVHGTNLRKDATQYFLLTPTAVPEPATWALTAAGCALLWARGRQRRTHRSVKA